MPRSRITTQFDFEGLNENVLQRVNRGVADFSSFIFSPAGAIAGATGLGAALAGVTNEYLQNARAVNRVSASTMTGTQAVSALTFAFNRFGYDISDVDAILAELEIKTYDWRDGVAGVSAAFQELNLDLDDFDRLSPDQKLREIASALSDVQSNSRRVGIADAIFGGDDARKVLALADDLDGLVDTAIRTGNVIDEESARMAEDFSRNLDTIQAVVTGAGTRIGQAIVNWGGPILQGFGQAVGILPDETRDKLEEVNESILSYIDDGKAAGMTWGEAVATGVEEGLFTKLDAIKAQFAEDVRLLNDAAQAVADNPQQALSLLTGNFGTPADDEENRQDGFIPGVRFRRRGSGETDFSDSNIDPVGGGSNISNDALSRALAAVFARSREGVTLQTPQGVEFTEYARPDLRAAIEQAIAITAAEAFKSQRDQSTFDLQRQADAFSESQRAAEEVAETFRSISGGVGGGVLEGKGLIDASKDDPVRVVVAGVGGLNEGAGNNQRFREIRIDGDELFNRDALSSLVFAILQDQGVV